jgi:hypothetical protein
LEFQQEKEGSGGEAIVKGIISESFPELMEDRILKFQKAQKILSRSISNLDRQKEKNTKSSPKDPKA